jgi:deazaflavin-dependent oxidoreductase (nitroreductase family)
MASTTGSTGLPFGTPAEHVRLYRESGGREGHDLGGGIRCLVLTTRGRRSGELRDAPICYVEDDGHFVVAASRAGSDHHPAWYLNLVAEPEVEIQVGADTHSVRARTLEGDERARCWARFVEAWDTYADYEKKTSRVIPVVALELA